ncbi:MAG: hypothetical protein RI910_94 [Verrucomicrobiota bacterium]|jgi:hypothetical protein
MRLSALQDTKAIYRVTGTPENYLTALKSSTWGFRDNPKLLSQWKKLQPGDVIFFHSSQSESRFLPAKALSSRVVGFGVVGNHFFTGTTPLWIEEFEEGRVIYPYRFHFSEIYLFADIPLTGDWDSQSMLKQANTADVIKRLLAAGIPLKELPGFPHMQSYSVIKDQAVKETLLTSTRGLYAYRTREEDEDALPTKQTQLAEVRSKKDLLRHTTGLTQFEDIGARVVRMDNGERTVDLRKLQQAETAHAEILSVLFDTLESRGYACFKNNHLDLLAVHAAQGRSLLIEAKSNENANFRAQARKGIAQLFEYNYFEMQRFKAERGLALPHAHQVLAFSQTPADTDYLGFLNHLKIRTLVAQAEVITPLGDLENFADLAG